MSITCTNDHRATDALGNPEWANGCAMCEIERLRAALTLLRDGLSWGCSRQHMFDIINGARDAQRQEE